MRTPLSRVFLLHSITSKSHNRRPEQGLESGLRFAGSGRAGPGAGSQSGAAARAWGRRLGRRSLGVVTGRQSPRARLRHGWRSRLSTGTRLRPTRLPLSKLKYSLKAGSSITSRPVAGNADF